MAIAVTQSLYRAFRRSNIESIHTAHTYISKFEYYQSPIGLPGRIDDLNAGLQPPTFESAQLFSCFLGSTPKCWQSKVGIWDHSKTLCQFSMKSQTHELQSSVKVKVCQVNLPFIMWSISPWNPTRPTRWFLSQRDGASTQVGPRCLGGNWSLWAQLDSSKGRFVVFSELV